jgi:hypothetical protein
MNACSPLHVTVGVLVSFWISPDEVRHRVLIGDILANSDVPARLGLKALALARPVAARLRTPDNATKGRVPVHPSLYHI